LCFSKNFSFLRSEELFSDSESEVVQSLSEFRVLVQRIKYMVVGYGDEEGKACPHPLH